MDIQEIKIIWIHFTNIPENPQQNFRKIYHPELEIYLYQPNSSKEVSQLTDLQIYKKNQNYLEVVNKHFRKAANKFQEDISSRNGDIPVLA